mmetsp:Transcript_3833/g.5863  ORF Transcript_3833/g.5863 Transcript_3833/m.5863 type:complete len:211 (+) Transcript_3833:112-744(+)
MTDKNDVTEQNDSKDVVDPYKSSSFIGHSLWMCPSEGSTACTTYTNLIQEMAAECGTSSFLPHITLVAGMMTSAQDVVERAKLVASKVAPYQYEFENISYRDAYFQCVYAQMKCTEQVKEANATARTIFTERQDDPPYMPHLSLVYGDFTEKQKKQEIIPKLQQKMKQITTTEKENHNLFTVEAIEVWSTQGDFKDWYLVERVPLKGCNK